MGYYCIFVFGTVTMFEFIEDYNFSFMSTPGMLSLLILYIGLIWFSKSWFHYLWGIFVGIVVIGSVVVSLFNHSSNTVAYIFDTSIALVLFLYYGYNIYQKINKNNQQI